MGAARSGSTRTPLLGSLSAEAAERLGDYLSRVGAEEIRTGEAAKRLADVRRQGREA